MHGCNKSDFLLLNLIGDKLNFMTDSGHLRKDICTKLARTNQ